MQSRPVFDLEELQLAFSGKKAGAMTRWVTKVYRAKVDGGWLVLTCGGEGFTGVTFYPDPNHRWDGGTAT